MERERLHKVLAARGVASRRASEELIAAGRVTVDGRIVNEVGTSVLPDADIRVDGRPVRQPHKAYYLLNKPRGYITTLSDELGRNDIGQLTRRLRARVYPVGRLDAETEGLLLLTNDGALTNVLTHPRFKVEKTYIVTVKGRMSEDAVNRLRGGIYLTEGRAVARVRVLRVTRDSTRLEMVIAQGYNRQIRRMTVAVGHEVKRLERVRFGPLRLKGIPRGGFRPLSKDEIAALHRILARFESGALDDAVEGAGEAPEAEAHSAAERKPRPRAGRHGASPREAGQSRRGRAAAAGRPAGPSRDKKSDAPDKAAPSSRSSKSGSYDKAAPSGRSAKSSSRDKSGASGRSAKSGGYGKSGPSAKPGASGKRAGYGASGGPARGKSGSGKTPRGGGKGSPRRGK